MDNERNMGEHKSKFDPTQPSTGSDGSEGGSERQNQDETPWWAIPGGLAPLWPEAILYGWTEDIGLNPTQKAALEETKKSMREVL